MRDFERLPVRFKGIRLIDCSEAHKQSTFPGENEGTVITKMRHAFEGAAMLLLEVAT